MRYVHEKIETNPLIPAKIYLGKENSGRYPLHWHGHLEFVLVLIGAVQVRIHQKETTITANGLYFVNSGDLHETDADQAGAVTVLLSLDLLKEVLPHAHDVYFDISGSHDKIRPLIFRCAAVYAAKDPYYEWELSIILRELCLILLRDCQAARPDDFYKRTQLAHFDAAKKAIAYMEDHFTEPLTLAEVAGAAGLAPTYFARLMRDIVNDSFYAYLTKIRLYFAHADLLRSGATVTEIALRNGFPNVKSFIEAFKRAYRATPDQYRRRQKDKN